MLAYETKRKGRKLAAVSGWKSFPVLKGALQFGVTQPEDMGIDTSRVHGVWFPLPRTLAGRESGAYLYPHVGTPKMVQNHELHYGEAVKLGSPGSR
ncbi:hypothetical protein Poly41_42110 [Novipirellula artificiosorum]|uniref:Uncharacterized protein n=1 Tax=Novipirellula artificiosorum TaxID=2528016 RepID=A0A5C6DGV9_9BACT|nr:hypothetical protein Poly41_42110 [Novipirellula artificiosorum]